MGYHGDNGYKFSNGGEGDDYSETYGIGDTVGYGVDNERRIFFYQERNTSR
jgi:hypothetical protein